MFHRSSSLVIAVFSPAGLTFSLLTSVGLWLPSQLYPVEILEHRPTPGSFSATGCCFLARWRTPAGRGTRPRASPLAIAPPMAPGRAQHQIASVRIATFTHFDYWKMFLPCFCNYTSIAYVMYPVCFRSCTYSWWVLSQITWSSNVNTDSTCQQKFVFLCSKKGWQQEELSSLHKLQQF